MSFRDASGNSRRGKEVLRKRETGRSEIPPDLIRARLVSTERVFELNQRARERHWAAFDPEELAARLDPLDRHCVFPMLTISADDGTLAGYRCFLWFKEAKRESRTLVILDVSDADLKSLSQIQEPNLHRLVGMLLDELPLVLLSETDESPGA